MHFSGIVCLSNIVLCLLCLFSCLIRCEVGAETGPDSGLYSIQFFSILEQSVQFQVTVNGITGSIIEVPETSPNSLWTNFSAFPGDDLSVKLVHLDAPRGLSYVINNGATGGGSQIYDSKTTTFRPVNTCPENEICEYRLYGNNFAGSTANLYVDNILVLQNFNATTVEYLNIAAGATITIVLTYGGTGDDMYYYINNISFGDEDNGWLYNSFGINSVIPNPIINPNRPPFGGQYYPITSEQISSIAHSIGGGNQNSEWIPLTWPFNYYG